MNLELKHLAAYLPYQLEMVGCQSKLNPNILDRWLNDEWEITPMLRPLSDLVNEIEYEGRKFIPIVELKNFQSTNGLLYIDKEKTIAKEKIIEVKSFTAHTVGTSYYVKYIEPYTNMDDGLIYFEYCEHFNRFGKVMLEPMRKPMSVGSQLEMFQMLFQWHFDVFRLIEQNLAVIKS